MNGTPKLSQLIPARVTVIVAILLVSAGLATNALSDGPSTSRVVLDGLGLVGIGLAAAASMFWAARRPAPQELHARVAWLVLAVAQVGRTIGDAAAISAGAGLTDRASLWPLDLIYLLADTLFVLGILLLRSPARTTSERVRFGLDLSISVVGGILVAWNFLVVPMSGSSGAAAWGIAISLAYATLYVVLLFVSFELAIGRRTPVDRSSILLLTGGAAARIFAGIAAVILCPPRGTCMLGNWDSLFWLVSYALVALAGLDYATKVRAATTGERAAPPRDQASSVWTLYVPYAGVIMAYLLLAFDTNRTDEVTSLVLTMGTGLIIVMVIARQIHVVYENVNLYKRSQREIEDRTRAEEGLRQARDELEIRVRERTAELVQANRSLHAEVEERRQLNEMGELLQACQTGEEAYRVVSRFGSELFPSQAGALCTINNSKTALEIVAAWGGSTASRLECLPGECWALRRGRPHLNADNSIGTMCGNLDRAAPKSYLCVPMIAQGEAIGVLRLEDRGESYDARRNGDRETTDTARQQLASLVAEHSALALKNLGLREALRNQAIRDPLTGLFNRRYMGETLERELSRAVRRNLPLAIVMFDVDQLKQFNDTYGHAAGDALLRGIGSTVKSQVRAEDVCCRYGGDEFIIILPETNARDAAQRAEQLRTSLSRLKIEYLGQSLDAVTISLGVSSLPGNGSTADQLLKAADAALYAAKHEGRDRIVFAAPLPA